MLRRVSPLSTPLTRAWRGLADDAIAIKADAAHGERGRRVEQAADRAQTTPVLVRRAITTRMALMRLEARGVVVPEGSDSDALADARTVEFRDDRAGLGCGEAGSTDRRERRRAVLSHLRRLFTAATGVVAAGARSPAIERALAGPGRLPDIVRSRSAPRRAAHVATAPSGPTLRQAGNGKHRHRDEASEAAALYRWVDRELDAEHMAQVAQERAEAERAATRIAHPDWPAPAASAGHREPILMPFGNGSRKRPGVVATGPVRPPPRHGRRADRSAPHLRGLDEGVQSRDEPMPAVAIVVTHDVGRQGLALMMARELERMHKRSRTRLARLAEAAGMDEKIFEGAASAEREEVFDLAAIVAEPALAQL